MSSTEARRLYERRWQTIAEVIKDWDPYGLLASGSPTDEFDSEISSLVAQIPRIRSAHDASHAVSRIFSSSFEPIRFAPDACSVVGAKLFQLLTQRGLLS